jgi:outer membrane lipopolysaccharide assembly protein LptE/RlpB
MVAGCGFHLRGFDQNQNLRDLMNKINVQMTNSKLDYQFKNTLIIQLRAANVDVAHSRQKANFIIKIYQTSASKQAISLTGALNASDKVRRYKVSYQVFGQNQQPITTVKTIKANEKYSTNATQQLSTNNVIKNIDDKLRKRIAKRMIDQLRTLKTSKSDT